MPIFIHQSLDANGRRKSGEIQAVDRADALETLQRTRLTPIFLHLKGVAGQSGSGLPLSLPWFLQRVSMADKILLTRHLAAVVRSGMSLHEALDILYEDARKPVIKRILADAKYNVERGSPLSAVFAMYPRHFSPVWVGMVQAGEKSGTLEEALVNLGDALMRDNELIKRVRSAMIYPSVLLAASAGVVVLLLTFLLPRLANVLASTRTELPLITRFFIGISKILSFNPLLTIMFFAAAVFGIFVLFRSRSGRAVLMEILHRLPIAQRSVRGLALARLTRTLHNLLKSGIGALEAFEITAQSVGDSVYEKQLRGLREDAKKGLSLSTALGNRRDYFPRLFISMITIGEKTGTLDKSLEILASFYDEETDRTMKNLVGILEPALLLVMGIIVGGVALSVLLPIYQLVGSFR